VERGGRKEGERRERGGREEGERRVLFFSLIFRSSKNRASEHGHTPTHPPAHTRPPAHTHTHTHARTTARTHTLALSRNTHTHTTTHTPTRTPPTPPPTHTHPLTRASTGTTGARACPHTRIPHVRPRAQQARSRAGTPTLVPVTHSLTHTHSHKHSRTHTLANTPTHTRSGSRDPRLGSRGSCLRLHRSGPFDRPVENAVPALARTATRQAPTSGPQLLNRS
jgi:hypothetical protein